MKSQFFNVTEGDSPLVAAAIHNGHLVRKEVADLLALDEATRLREEDPYTELWTTVVPNRVVVNRSRFEVDLNRPRGQAVYRRPEDAWGLQVWNRDLPLEFLDKSLAEYDAFYTRMHQLFTGLVQRFGCFLVFDLHTYNHRRSGPISPSAASEENPDINVGTGTMDRSYWGPVVDRFITDLRSFDFPGGVLDVKENVRFKGGNFSKWIHDNFPGTGCALAVEVKKFFMDEWTGEVNEPLLMAVGRALQSTVPGVIEQLKCLQKKTRKPSRS